MMSISLLAVLGCVVGMAACFVLMPLAHRVWRRRHRRSVAESAELRTER
jgi:hypothetical protein